MPDSVERDIGALESGLEAIKDSLIEIRRGQETLARDFNVGLEKERRSREDHAKDDRMLFEEVRKNFNDIFGKMAVMDNLASMVESHGDALVHLEGRIDEVEETERSAKAKEEVHSAVKSNNERWLRIITYGVLLLVGAKFSEWIPALVKLVFK